MGTLARLQTPRKAEPSRAEATQQAPTAEQAAAALTILRAYLAAGTAASADEAIPLSQSGLEEKAWRKLIRSGQLRARKIGREWWTTKQALCGLILEHPAPAKRSLAPAYADLVAASTARAK
jgi:hypothetical protein